MNEFVFTINDHIVNFLKKKKGRKGLAFVYNCLVIEVTF